MIGKVETAFPNRSCRTQR